MRMLHWAMAVGLLLPCLAVTADTGQARPRHARCTVIAARTGSGKCAVPRRAGLVHMTQIPSHIRRSRAPNLDEPPCRTCLGPPDGWYWRHAARKRRAPRPDLIEALQQPPNAATAPVLNEAGIPAVPDVPPIVTLQSKGGRARARAETESQP